MLGTALVELLVSRGERYVGLSRAELDICDAVSVRRTLEEIRPRRVFNAAAFTEVDACEDRRDHAMEVNGYAVGRLARAALDVGATLVHVSSDYVFDGTATIPYREDDATSPSSVYGESKLQGEIEALTVPGTLIVRASWLFGPGGSNFVTTIAKAAREQSELRVVDDQRGAPTYTPFLAEALISLAQHNCEGIWHYRNREDVTWYEFARAIVGVWRASCDVIPVTTDEFPRKAKRPAYSVLDISSFEEQLGPASPWLQGLKSYHRILEGL